MSLPGRIDRTQEGPVARMRACCCPGKVVAHRGAPAPLAAYRLARAALAGCPVERVRAAFPYVRADVTLHPAALPDADGLRALVAAVPETP